MKRNTVGVAETGPEPKTGAFMTPANVTNSPTTFGFDNKEKLIEDKTDPKSGGEKSETAKQTLRTFVETSSVKGVPKIFKSKTLVQRLLWGICLVIGLSIGLAQVVLLFLQYFSYTTVITTEEIQAETPTFPDISICNINPIATDLQLNYSYSDYLVDIYSNGLSMVFDDLSSIQILNDMQDYMFWHTFSAEGYFQNMPLDEDANLAGFQDTLINACIWTPWEFETSTDDVECDTVRSQINYFYHSQYGPCFTLKLGSTKLAKKMEKFSAFIYLQDIGGTNLFEMKLTTGWSYSTGVKVQVHPRGTLPDMRSARVAAPGHETTLWVEETRRKRMKQPYGDCYDRADLPKNKDYKYQQTTCNSLCYQQRVIDQCDCITRQQLFTPEMRREHPFCGQMNYDNYNDTYGRHVCQQEASRDDSCSCKPACEEVVYTSRVDQAPWPHASHHVSFYYDVVYTVPDYTRFSLYDTIIASGTYDDLLATDLIHRNFLQLNVNMGKVGFSAVSDTQKLSLVSLAGALGGILNLWIGITFVTLIEVCDLVYQLIANKCRKQNDRNEVQPISANTAEL